jgi:uncharacterized protein YndB with AHSA1/START domain
MSSRKVQPIQVYVSCVIDAPIEKVWALVRDFNALPEWHPGIAQSQIEDSRESSVVGCVRRFVLKGGEKVREQLLDLSDTHHRFTYSILESDVGLLDYIAEFALSPVTDGDDTFAVWSANFRTAPGLEIEKEKMVAQDVFQRGFEALKVRLARR